MKKNRNNDFDRDESKALKKIILDEFDAIEKAHKQKYLYPEDEWEEEEFCEDLLEKNQEDPLHAENEWEEDEYTNDRRKQSKSLKPRPQRPLKRVPKEKEPFKHDLHTDEDAKVIEIKQKRRPLDAEQHERQRFAATPQPESDADFILRAEDLFDKDEEKFIANVVKWLLPKENKDIIISKIWNLLTEAAPDSFYTPETEEAEPAESESGGTENPASNQTEPKNEAPETGEE